MGAGFNADHREKNPQNPAYVAYIREQIRDMMPAIDDVEKTCKQADAIGGPKDLTRNAGTLNAG